MIGYRFIMRVTANSEDGHEPGWWLFFWPIDGGDTLEWGPFDSMQDAVEFRDRTVH